MGFQELRGEECLMRLLRREGGERRGGAGGVQGEGEGRVRSQARASEEQTAPSPKPTPGPTWWGEGCVFVSRPPPAPQHSPACL